MTAGWRLVHLTEPSNLRFRSEAPPSAPQTGVKPGGPRTPIAPFAVLVGAGGIEPPTPTVSR